MKRIAIEIDGYKKWKDISSKKGWCLNPSVLQNFNRYLKEHNINEFKFQFVVEDDDNLCSISLVSSPVTKELSHKEKDSIKRAFLLVILERDNRDILTNINKINFML